MMNSKHVPKRRFKEFESDGEWEQKNLSSIADIRDGTHSSPKYLEVGHPFITSKNVANGFISFEDIQYISNEDFNEINKRSKVDVHDILMGMIGTVGNLALIRQTPFFAIKNVALIKYTGDVDYEFLYQALQTSNVNRQLKDSIDGGTQKFISLKKIRNLNIPFSNISEQLKIGKFFQTIDLLIQLHQHKLDKLKDLKKAYLTEMFPAEGKRVPKRRFPGFEGEWEKVLLGKVVDFSIKTNSFSREKLTQESYEVQNIHYGDILVKFQSVLDLKRDNLPSIIDSSVLDFRQSLLQDGDVIFADAAEDSTVGKAIEIRNIMGKNVVSGLHTIAARPRQLFAQYYLGYYLNSDTYHNQILSLMQGTKVSSISKSNLQVTEISFPIIDEQKQIGNFFKKLDQSISLQQQKLDKLNDLKKAYLNELFV